MTFQSRFGREPWLMPYTDETLKMLGEKGVGHIQVMCPGFAADCLETLEEIAEQNREVFLGAGGKKYEYIPAPAIGGSASNFFHRFIAAIPGFFVSTGNMVISICVGLFKFIFCFFLYAIMALFETVKKILYYRNYMAQTADCLEKDSSALQCIRDRMEYSRVMNENRGMSLADLMNEGSELYNNSYARMVQEQGEEKAEAFVSRCTTQIAENGEIIRSFAA